MAASIVSRSMRSCPTRHCAITVQRALKSAAETPAPLNRVLLKLNDHFDDVERFVFWKTWWRINIVYKYQNMFFGYLRKKYGPLPGVAFFIFMMKGSFRLAGQSEWFNVKTSGQIKFLRSPVTDIEDVDLSGTLMNHNRLLNLTPLITLKTLCLRGCPQVDDWFLAHLHVFEDSLLELDLSHCSRVTVGGLAALQHLRKLQRLNITGLSHLQSPGLVRILLEEMLPCCQIVGDEQENVNIQMKAEEQTEEEASTQTKLRQI